MPARAGDASRGAALAEPCAACHGPRGRSAMENVPSLAGQPETYLTLQLILFREKLRDVEPMSTLVRELTDAQVEDIAAYYAGLPPGFPPGQMPPPGAALLARARPLAEAAHCNVCHLPSYAGRDNVPRLAGQREDYLRHALQGYRDGSRTGADTQMNGIAAALSAEDIAALAHFLARRN
nr:c-type cytochrome [Roseomonas acroporae]